MTARKFRHNMWTADQDEFLLSRNSQGVTAEAIFREVRSKYPDKHMTRNSVIGRLWRLKGTTNTKRVKVNDSAKPKSPPVIKKPRIHILDKPIYRIALPSLPARYLAPGTCQYIEGNGAPYTKCGADCVGSWCTEHLKLIKRYG